MTSSGDERITAGMEEQLRTRAERLAAGEEHVGWKLGLGSPAAREKLRIERPLVGYLTDRGRVEPGAEYSLAGFENVAALEPEIAIHMGTPLASGADRDAARAAIRGLGPAIELADVDEGLAEVRGILARNIFQRAFVLGPVRKGIAERFSARIHDGDELIAETYDPLAAVGDLIDLTRHVADVLSAARERLEAGDVIISGSVVPFLRVSPGQHIRIQIEPLGALELQLTG